MKAVYDIAWDIKAGEDLERIYQYLFESASEEVVRRVKKAIITAVGQLRTQPERYPPDPLLVTRSENFRYIRLCIKSFMSLPGRKLLLPGYFILNKILKKHTRIFKSTNWINR